MKPYFAVALLVAFAVSRCNASEGIYPPAPGSKPGGWNAKVPTATVGWNSPAPATHPSTGQSQEDLIQEQPKKYPVEDAQKIVPNAYTPIIHPKPKVVDWATPVWQIPQVPVVQKVAIHHGTPYVHPQAFPRPYVVKVSQPQPIPQVAVPQPILQEVTIPQPPPKTRPPVPVQIPARFAYDSCMPPRHVLDFTWDSVAYRNRDVETFYTPLAHHQTTNSFHRAITGFNMRLSDSVEDVCLTTALNWNDLSAVVTTFGTNKENYQCRYLEGRNKLSLECVPVGHQGEAFRIYFTKSDDHTYLVAYHCWEGGSVEWFTFSNIKILPHQVKHEILRHVETLGFNPKEYKETDYQRCFPDPGVLVPAGETFRDECSVPAHLVQKYTWVPTKPLHGGEQEVWYMPMAHQAAYNNFNKIINGETLRGNQNLNNFCMKSTRNINSRSETFSGFSGEVPITCNEVPNYFRNIGNAWVATCRNNYNEEMFTSFVTKTDHRTYRLVKQCWKNGETTWIVYSTEKTLPIRIRNEIREHVVSLGFNPQDTQEIAYEFCTDHKTGYVPTENKPFEQEREVLGPQCVPPPPQFIKDFYYDSAPYQLKRTEGFYMPLAGKDGFSSINQFITGNRFPSSEITRKGFCSKYELDWRNLDSRFLESTYQTGQTERLNCRLIKYTNTNRDLHGMECFKENGVAAFRSYVTLTDHKTYFVAKHCWNSGPTTWILFSSEPKVSRELKQQVLAHVQELGFRRDHDEATYSSCSGEQHVHQPSVESETDTLGSTTGLFPKCSPPSSFLRRFTWESSSYNQGIEFLDVAMAHPAAAEIYRQSLGQQIDVGTNRGYGFSQHFQNQSPNCLRFRMNHDTNITRHIGYGETVSSDFICTYAANQEWIMECVSKSSPWLSYRNYGIKSDNLSWMLTYQCLNSDVSQGSWTLWVAPGTSLTPQTKSGILRTVESLGFNGKDFVEFGSHQCTYKNRLYKHRTCDCCTEANARYI